MALVLSITEVPNVAGQSELTRLVAVI
jgi:hypothetical protein